MQNQARGLRGSCLTQAEFVTVLAEELGCDRSLTKAELDRASSFFLRNAPLAKEPVQAALRKAIAAKSAALRMRYYLEAIRAGRAEERAS